MPKRPREESDARAHVDRPVGTLAPGDGSANPTVNGTNLGGAQLGVATTESRSLRSAFSNSHSTPHVMPPASYASVAATPTVGQRQATEKLIREQGEKDEKQRVKNAEEEARRKTKDSEVLALQEAKEAEKRRAEAQRRAAEEDRGRQLRLAQRREEADKRSKEDTLRAAEKAAKRQRAQRLRDQELIKESEAWSLPAKRGGGKDSLDENPPKQHKAGDDRAAGGGSGPKASAPRASGAFGRDSRTSGAAGGGGSSSELHIPSSQHDHPDSQRRMAENQERIARGKAQLAEEVFADLAARQAAARARGYARLADKSAWAENRARQERDKDLPWDHGLWGAGRTRTAMRLAEEAEDRRKKAEGFSDDESSASSEPCDPGPTPRRTGGFAAGGARTITGPAAGGGGRKRAAGGADGGDDDETDDSSDEGTSDDDASHSPPGGGRGPGRGGGNGGGGRGDGGGNGGRGNGSPNGGRGGGNRGGGRSNGNGSGNRAGGVGGGGGGHDGGGDHDESGASNGSDSSSDSEDEGQFSKTMAKFRDADGRLRSVLKSSLTKLMESDIWLALFRLSSEPSRFVRNGISRVSEFLEFVQSLRRSHPGHAAGRLVGYDELVHDPYALDCPLLNDPNALLLLVTASKDFKLDMALVSGTIRDADSLRRALATMAAVMSVVFHPDFGAGFRSIGAWVTRHLHHCEPEMVLVWAIRTFFADWLSMLRADVRLVHGAQASMLDVRVNRAYFLWSAGVDDPLLVQAAMDGNLRPLPLNLRNTEALPLWWRDASSRALARTSAAVASPAVNAAASAATASAAGVRADKEKIAALNKEVERLKAQRPASGSAGGGAGGAAGGGTSSKARDKKGARGICFASAAHAMGVSPTGCASGSTCPFKHGPPSSQAEFSRVARTPLVRGLMEDPARSRALAAWGAAKSFQLPA